MQQTFNNRNNRSSIKTDKTNQSFLLSSQNQVKHTRFEQDGGVHGNHLAYDANTLEQLSVDLLPSTGQNGSFYQINGAHPGGVNDNNMLTQSLVPNRQAQQQDNYDFYAPIREDASVEARAKIQDL